MKRAIGVFGEGKPDVPHPVDIKELLAKIRRAVRTRGHFPNDESASKPIFLVLRLVAEKRGMPSREFMAAKAQFAIVFEDRFIPQ